MCRYDEEDHLSISDLFPSTAKRPNNFLETQDLEEGPIRKTGKCLQSLSMSLAMEYKKSTQMLMGNGHFLYLERRYSL